MKQIVIKLRMENVHNLTFAYFSKASKFTSPLSKPPSKLKFTVSTIHSYLFVWN